MSAKEDTKRNTYSLPVLDRLRISVILVDRDYKIVYFNQKAREIKGREQELVTGMNVFDVIRLRNADGRKFDLKSGLDSIFSKTSGPLYDMTCNYLPAADGESWFSVCLFPLESGAEELNHVVMCMQDITQNHVIENTLKELEIRYETVFNSVNDGIFLFEPNKFRLVDVNDRIGEMYGYTKNEIRVKRIEELSVAEEGFTNRRGLLYALRAMRGDVRMHEWYARDKTGRTFWTRLMMKKVIIGEVPFIMGIIKDIDDQKKAELSLRISEEQYRALAQNSPDVIIRFDRALKYLYVNDAIKTIFPVEPEKFLHRTHREMGLFSPEMCDFLEGHLEKVFKTSKPKEVGFYIDTPIKRVYIEWRLFPEFDSKGQIDTVLAVARDITEEKESQIKLRKSKERLQLAHEVTRDGMWDWDVSTGQMYYSPRFFTMLGYEPGEFGQSFDSVSALIHPDDLEKVNQTYNQQRLLHADNAELELRGRKKDGSYIWILSRGKVFNRDANGFPARVVGTTVDISHRKRQEDIRNVLINISDAVNTTRSLDEFYGSIRFHLGKVIDTKNCYIALYDKSTGKITLPFHRDERDRFKEFPAGKTITSYVIRTGHTQLLNSEKINELIEAGEIEVIGALSVSWLGVPLRIEDELIGVFVVQSYDKSVVYTEEDVQILEFVSDQIAMAISRKKDQDRIFENQVRQLQIFESLPDGLLVTTHEGLILDYNSRIIEMLRSGDDKIRMGNFRQFVCPSEWNKVAAIFRHTIESGIRTQDEIKILRVDQTEFYAEISMGLLQQAEDKPVTFVIIVKDIDERKADEIRLKIAKEKAEEADRLKTAFLSNMSHEIRTPLNAIIGFADLLSRGDSPPDERKEFISQINYGAESLMRLIDDIIDIAKIEAGQVKIYNVFFDLASVFRDLVMIFARNLQRQNKQNIKLIEDNNGHNPSVQLYGDQVRIRQILINLLNNAIKFTDEGEIRFGIRNISDGMISFYVKDTGIGIPHEKLDIIFDRFRQGHETKAKSYGGTGLGLAISKQLVEMMGGNISVRSDKGIGSEFIFSIPFISVEEDGIGAENLFEKMDLNWQDKIILIAEDDPSNFFLLSEILKSTDVRIIRAADGREAVDIVNSDQHIDLILMDVQLPKLSGYEAARIIRGKRPDIPIIAQTAYGMADEKQESLKAGCDDYVRKPIKMNDLFVVISKYIHA